MIKVIELFAGIGSQTQALKNIGVEHEVIGISEWEVNAIITYDAIHTNDGIDYTENMSKKEIIDFLDNFTFSTDGKNPCDIKKLSEKTLRNLYNSHKRSKNLGSILDIEKLNYADLWTYSFPCQDISVAGKQEGIKEGTRSGLLYEVERLLEVSEKPKYLLLENVKNLIGKKHIDDFGKWLNKLEELGYNNYWKVLNAKNYGVAQNRERVFVVSIRKDLYQDYIFQQGFDNGLRLKDFLESEVEEKYYISQEKTEKLIENLSNKRVMDKLPKGEELKIIGTTQNPGAMGTNFRSWVYDINGKVGTLSATMAKEPTQICIPCITPDRLEKRQNGRRFKEDGEPMFTLTAQDRHGILQVGMLDIKGNEQIRRVYSDEGLSPTLNTMQGGNRQPKVLQDYRIRKLTPKECYRLMGFKDVEFENAKASGVSDSQLYKQAGNSIVVDVLEAIFKNLFFN